MKNLLKIQALLITTLFFFIGSIDAQTYTPDVSKGKTAIWDYGGGGFGGEFKSFNKTNFQANVVSYGNSWYGTHQNTSRRGITPSGGPGMVWEPGQVVMHPGQHQTQNTKIKFTAPSDGTYEISAKWTNLQACSKKHGHGFIPTLLTQEENSIMVLQEGIIISLHKAHRVKTNQ